MNDIDHGRYAIYLKGNDVDIPLHSVYEVTEDKYDPNTGIIFLMMKGDESTISCSYNSILDMCAEWVIIPKVDILLETTLIQLKQREYEYRDESRIFR